MSLNVLTALFFALTGIAVGSRQILLSGSNQMWPCAPLAVRLAMFIAAVSCGWMATLFFGHARPYAGEAAVPVSILAGILAMYAVVMFLNVVVQRRPVAVWRRLNRIWAKTCRPRRRLSPEFVVIRGSAVDRLRRSA